MFNQMVVYFIYILVIVMVLFYSHAYYYLILVILFIFIWVDPVPPQTAVPTHSARKVGKKIVIKIF